MKVPPRFLAPEELQSHRRSIKRAWAAYWVAFFVFLGLAGEGDMAAVSGCLLMAAAAIWLAVTVSRAASAKGMTGPLWGLGTVALGPLGGILFPWLILLKL